MDPSLGFGLVSKITPLDALVQEGDGALPRRRRQVHVPERGHQVLVTRELLDGLRMSPLGGRMEVTSGR